MIIHFLSAEAGAISTSLGTIFHMSDSFLSLSISAWGKQVNNMATSYILIRKGETEMVLASCFADPLTGKYSVSNIA